MFKAFFFDMDGTLFDSMPHHAEAWDIVMKRHGLVFTPEECYLNEGRTSQDVIAQCVRQQLHREATPAELHDIYEEKTDLFFRLGNAEPIPGSLDVLHYLQSLADTQIWIVTGSGQQTLFDTLNHYFPAVFVRERMITAYDVLHGKPDPEPYLKAWERSGLSKEDCCVIENAPLGVVSAKAAGLYTYAVNTGPLDNEVLFSAGADCVVKDMSQLLAELKK